jgi:hypothetical protein
MKKLLCLLLAALILVPAGVLAEAKDPSFYAGAWVDTCDSDILRSVQVLFLHEDGSAYFLRLNVKKGEIEPPTCQLRNWIVSDDGIVLAAADGSPIHYTLYGDNALGQYHGLIFSGYTRFRNADPKKDEQAALTEDFEPLEVPIGEYIVGEDLPAGTYRIDYVNWPGIVMVWPSEAEKKDEYYSFTFNQTINKNNKTIGKLKLEAGNVISVSSAVLFSVYKGLGR